MNATTVPACWLWPLPDPDLDRPFGDLEAMADWQDDRCAVCGKKLKSSRMVLDHDHETALIRGYLCRGCNVKEGTSGARRIELYRLINPASIFGMEERYVDSWGREAVPRDEDPIWNLPVSAFMGRKAYEALMASPSLDELLDAAEARKATP
jgi:recombination endonuclease VII